MKRLLTYIIFLAGLSFMHAQKIWTFDSTDFAITPFALNSASGEHSAYFNGDHLVYVSDREKRFGVVIYDEKTGQQMPDIYRCRFTAQQSDRGEFLQGINTPYTEGPSCISADGIRIWYTSSHPRYLGAANRFTILSSSLVDGKWSDPARAPFLPDSVNGLTPFLSPDGLSMYFASNMPGGYGGYDIYVSRMENGKWTKAENLGPSVNTSDNEYYPCADGSGHLFFTSGRMKGMGGLDIYVTDPGSKDSKPELLPAPYNSSSDDFAFYIDSEFRRACWSCNRNGNDDIFLAFSTWPEFRDCHPMPPQNFCFTFFEESSNTVQDTAQLFYEWDFGDGSRGRGIEADHCFRAPGKYRVKLNLVEKMNQHIFFQQASYEFEVERPEGLVISGPDTVKAGAFFTLDGGSSWLSDRQIGKFFWRSGKNLRKRGEKVPVCFQAPGQYEVMMGVTSTGHDGKESFQCVSRNIVVLSGTDYLKWQKDVQQRKKAETVFMLDTLYNIDLKDTGISFSVFLGSSPSQIPKNSRLFNGVKNVKEIYRNGIYRYTAGETKKIVDLLPTLTTVKQRGFTHASVVALKDDSILNNGVDLSVRIRDSSVVAAYTLFFSAGIWELEKKQKHVLDSLAKVVSGNRDLKVFIGGHSDRHGNPYTNFTLSERRAMVVRDFLVSKGCNYKKIDIAGYGSDMPLESNESEIGRKLNRRADIIIHY